MQQRALLLMFFCVVWFSIVSQPVSTIIFSFIPTSSFSAASVASPHESENKLGDATIVTTAKQPNDTVPVYDAMVFVGDVMLGRHVEVLRSEKGKQYPFLGVDLRLFGDNTAVIGNFESSMCDPHIRTPFYTMRFSTDREGVAALADAGFTHMSLANNHSFDCGTTGYETAWNNLKDAQLHPFGSQKEINEYSVQYLKTPTGTAALIGIHLVHTKLDNEVLNELFSAVQVESTYQIVYVHWGNEYEVTHSKQQRRYAEQLVAAGADLILGHHPHVVQGVEMIGSVPVFYSLGNYIFDQYFSDEVKTGLLLELTFSEFEPALILHPVTTQHTKAQPRLMLGQERTDFLSLVADRGEKDLKESVLAGVVPLPLMVATSTKIAIMVR
jgi:hypothetical protein